MNDNLTDLNMSGVGTASGGAYNHVVMDGMCKVAGDLQAESFRFSGVGTVFGSVSTPSFEMNGKLKIEGKLSAEQAKFDGMIDVGGSLDGDRLSLNGLLNVRGDCVLEQFNVLGGFEVDGLLNAGTIDIALQAKGKAREIGGETIKVRKLPTGVWKRMFDSLIDRWAAELHTDFIEGDDIDLTHTVASVVRGNRVKIGPGCRIGRVEYRTELQVHPAAKVNEEVKVGG